MAGWEGGLTAMDATHLANKRVEAQFGIVSQYTKASASHWMLGWMIISAGHFGASRS